MELLPKQFVDQDRVQIESVRVRIESVFVGLK